jgi:serine/threonine protein kinase
MNYRYEIVKKLGRGAFGVVLRCIDHAHPEREHVAMKILKNKKDIILKMFLKMNYNKVIKNTRFTPSFFEVFPAVNK